MIGVRSQKIGVETSPLLKEAFLTEIDVIEVLVRGLKPGTAEKA
jgi:hypothetical protein